MTDPSHQVRSLKSTIYDLEAITKKISNIMGDFDKNNSEINQYIISLFTQIFELSKYNVFKNKYITFDLSKNDKFKYKKKIAIRGNYFYPETYTIRT